MRLHLAFISRSQAPQLGHTRSAVELEPLGHVRQSRLRTGPGAFDRFLRRPWNTDFFALSASWSACLVSPSIKRLLQLVLVARVERKRVALTLELADQLLDLCERDPSKLLDILLALEIGFEDRHISFLIMSAIRNNSFRSSAIGVANISR